MGEGQAGLGRPGEEVLDRHAHRANGGSLGSVTKDGVFASLGTQRALAESAFALGEGGIGGLTRPTRAGT